MYLCHGHILAQQILLEQLYICPIQHTVPVGVTYRLLRKVCRVILHCLPQQCQVHAVHCTVMIPVSHAEIGHRFRHHNVVCLAGCAQQCAVL